MPPVRRPPPWRSFERPGDPAPRSHGRLARLRRPQTPGGDLVPAPAPVEGPPFCDGGRPGGTTEQPELGRSHQERGRQEFPPPAAPRGAEHERQRSPKPDPVAQMEVAHGPRQEDPSGGAAAEHAASRELPAQRIDRFERLEPETILDLPAKQAEPIAESGQRRATTERDQGALEVHGRAQSRRAAKLPRTPPPSPRSGRTLPPTRSIIPTRPQSRPRQLAIQPQDRHLPPARSRSSPAILQPRRAASRRCKKRAAEADAVERRRSGVRGAAFPRLSARLGQRESPAHLDRSRGGNGSRACPRHARGMPEPGHPPLMISRNEEEECRAGAPRDRQPGRRTAGTPPPAGAGAGRNRSIRTGTYSTRPQTTIAFSEPSSWK